MAKCAHPMPRKKKPSKNPNGAGSVYWSSAKNRYVGAIGSPRRYIYGPRDDASETARLAITEKLNPLRKHRPSEGGRAAFGDFIENWMKVADLRNNTRATYTWAVENYILPSALARKRLDSIQPIDIRNFYGSLKPLPPKLRKDGQPMQNRSIVVGDDTKRKIHIVLHRVLEEAVDLELIDRNPADRVKAPRVRRRRMQVWEPDEVLVFLRVARSDPYYAMYLLALMATMGPAELFGLQKPDIHLKGGYIWVITNLEDVGGKIALDETKTDARRRRIDLPPPVVDALREHLKKNIGTGNYVFTSPEGKPLRRGHFRLREWKPLLERVAVEAEKQAREAGNPDYRFPRIRFYDLRHTANALMGFLGVPLQVARERMGHSSITTTDDVYGHLYPSMQREVAEKQARFLEAL